MKRTFLITGAILGLISILLGAFGAHGLEKMVDANSVDSFGTGVTYQMYHALLFLFAGIWDGMEKNAGKTFYRLILIGVVLFSGSIYVLVLGKAFSFNLKYLGPVTPVGGVLLISGWIFLLYRILTSEKEK